MKKVLWTGFLALAGLVLACVVDPATAQQIVGLITGTGVREDPLLIIPMYGIEKQDLWFYQHPDYSPNRIQSAHPYHKRAELKNREF